MIAVVGAGPTGLALTWYLARQGLDVQLFEGSDRPGGNVRSALHESCLLEYGPNSLRMDDALHAFLEEVGLAQDLVYASPAARHRYVLHEGQYCRLPTGPLSFLFGGFFTFAQKRRILRERKLPALGTDRETVDGFFRRRFGDAVADRVVGPMVSGIYAGDARQLINAAAFPQLQEMERQHGSVLKGMVRAGGKNQHKGIFSFRNGLQTLTDRLAAQVGKHIHLAKPLQGLTRAGQGWQLQFPDQTVTAEKVVLALPAHQLARILKAVAPEAATALAWVSYPPVTVVHALYYRSDISHPLDGFGALHNPLQERNSLGTIFSSTLFPTRSPGGTVLLSTLVGGAVRPSAALRPEPDLLDGVLGDHQRFLGAKGTPIFAHTTRYPKAIPQYDRAVLGLDVLCAPLRSQNLWLAGNWTGGVSVPNCIQRAKDLCEQLQATNP